MLYLICCFVYLNIIHKGRYLVSLLQLQHIGAQRGAREAGKPQFIEAKMPSGDEQACEQQSETNEEESLQRLKRIRGGNRSKATKFIQRSL